MKVLEPLTPELEKQNFRNLIHFHRVELRRIINGEKASFFFSVVQMTKFKGLNILRSAREGSSLRRLMVTEEARRCLEIEEKKE